MLDTARYRSFLAAEVGCSVEDVHALLLGGHGDDMVPLARYTFAGGIPITQLVKNDRLDEIIQRARDGGAEIVKLLKTGSAYYAPAAATVQMAEPSSRTKSESCPVPPTAIRNTASADYFVGVPCVLGTDGVERIIEIELDEAERKMFKTSVDHVKELVKVVKM